MRRNALRLTAKQHGAALIISLILLFAITLAVISTSQQLLVEQHISANQNDQQQALQLAQITLEIGERKAQELDPQLANLKAHQLFGNSAEIGIFSADCHNPNNPKGFTHGLCLDTAHMRNLIPSEEREARVNGDTPPILSPCGHAIEYSADSSAKTDCRHGRVIGGQALWANPRYLIELLDPSYHDGEHSPGRLYRITARAWGHHRNTQITQQSYYLAPSTEPEATPVLLNLLETRNHE